MFYNNKYQYLDIVSERERERVNNIPASPKLSVKVGAFLFSNLKTAAILFCVGFLFFGLPSQANATKGPYTTYFVGQSATGNESGIDVSNLMSVAVHNSKASDYFAGGDVIYLVDAITSRVAPVSSGSSSHQLIYKGDYLGHPGTIDVEGAASSCFNINGNSYITVEYLTVANSTAANIYGQGTTTGFIVDNITSNGGVHSIFITGGNNVSVTNNTINQGSGSLIYFYNQATTINTINVSGNTINGIYPSSGTRSRGVYLTNIVGLIFNSNTVTNWSGSAASFSIDIDTVTNLLSSDNIVSGGNGTVRFDDVSGTVENWNVNNLIATYNRVYDILGVSSLIFSACVAHDNANNDSLFDSDGFTINGSSTVTINDSQAYNNTGDGFQSNENAILTCNRCLAYNNGVASHQSSGDGFTSHDSAVMNVYYSVAYGNKKSGYASANSATISGKLYNNTFYNNIGTQSNQEGVGINIRGGNWDLKNNITYGHTREVKFSGESAGTITSDYNIFYNPAGGTIYSWHGTNYDWANYKTNSGIDTNSNNTNPLFTDVDSDDFSLQSTSPAIDTGADLGDDYDDAIYPGSTWPSSVTTADQDLRGSGWEIGAYIYPVPQAPTIGTPGALTSSSLRWNFTDNASDETGFRVYDNTDTMAASSATSDLTYLDEESLSENTSYSGRYVKTYNSYGESTASATASSLYTLAGTPTNLSVTYPSNDTVNLSADSFTNDTVGSSGYYFYRSGDEANHNSGWIQTNAWDDSSFSCSTNYTWYVKYKNAEGTETSTASVNSSGYPRICGGGLPATASNPPIIPDQGFKVLINNGLETTNNRIVTLSLSAGSDTKKIAISEYSDFNDASLEEYVPTKIYTLSKGNGLKTIYVKFYTQYGIASEIVSDTIILKSDGQSISPQGNTGDINEQKQEIMSKIIEILQSLINLYSQLLQMKLSGEF